MICFKSLSCILNYCTAENLQFCSNRGKCVCCSKETLLLEPEKSAPRIETLEPEKVDEEEEGKKDESSCSSEEEEDEDSESENEAGTVWDLF